MNQAILRKRARVLYVDGNTLYAQIGNNLCISDDNGITWEYYPLKLAAGARAYSRMHARLMRRGIHSLKILHDGKILLVAKNVISVVDSDNENIVRSFSIPRGSRPLFVCENKDGDIFWGEYFLNPKRDEVNIYVSKEQAQSWQIIYSFKQNSIRHVHGVFCDPYDDRIWVTTGDEDHESAIWVTDDKFEALDKVIGSNQQSRALQLLFTQEHVYFGTDIPFEPNHICRLDKSSGIMEKLIAVKSPIYWGCKVNESLFFSTAVEPSKINNHRYACVWGSPNGDNWKCVTRFRKDFFSMRYFQYGQIFFPAGINNSDYLWFTPIATQEDQTIQRLNVKTKDV